MNICLIIPPSSFLMDERVFMSLGVLKVAASLEQAGYHPQVLDLSGVQNYEDVVRLYVRAHAIDLYEVTATTPQMPAAMKIAAVLPESAIRCIGGPHPTLVMAAMKQERKRGVEDRAHAAFRQMAERFNVIVAGDGELAIHRAIQEARTGRGRGEDEARKHEETRGQGEESQCLVVDADDPGSGLFLSSAAFNESPWPARHLIDVDSYRYQVDGERALSVISQLGCPFRCTFCAGRNSPMLRRMRVRNPDNAVAEIVHLYDTYGVRGCMFLDDEVNVSKGMVDLMRGLKREADRRGIEWRLRGFLKAELFTDEQAEAMYAAGFRQLLIGFEAADERILANIQKNATVAENTRAVEIAKRHGLKVKALMSIGHAGETEQSVMAVRDWLLEVKPADFDCTVITPYPGSPYYDEAVPHDGSYRYTAPKTGDHLYMENVDFSQEAQFYKGGPGTYRSYVWTDALSREDIVRLRDYVEEDVRKRLGIPFYASGSAIRYEASMGQLPGYILKGPK